MLTEHNLQDVLLKHGRSAGNGAYVLKGTASRMMVASRPEISLMPDARTSPRDYE
jgi:hypothetical protein